MSIQREMTLQEWVYKLPPIHSARKELGSMQTTIAQQTERIAELGADAAIERTARCQFEDRTHRQAQTIAEQAALIEKFEKDASRYRWAISCDENAEILYSCAMCGIDPSAEIDAAIAAHKGAA